MGKDKAQVKTKQPFWRRPMLYANLSGIAIFLLVLWFGLQMILSCVTNHGEVSTVPNVEGLPIDSARSALLAAGLNEPVIDSIYRREMTSGLVIEQTPRAGHVVKCGRTPHLTVSRFVATRCPLPDIIDNSSEQVARNRLLLSGFIVEDEAEYIDGDAGWVYGARCMGRSIDNNELVPIDKPITLIVGNGENDEAVSDIVDTLTINDIHISNDNVVNEPVPNDDYIVW